MKSFSVLLLCSVVECLVLPPILQQNHNKANVKDDANIAVAYLAGIDCDTCEWGNGNTVGMLRFDTAQWCFGQVTKFDIGSHNTQYLDGTAYIISGAGTLTGRPLTGANYLRTVETYNPANNSYSTAPDVNVGRQQFASAVNGDKIYISGGYTKASDDCNTTEIFDGTSWTFGPETLIPRAGQAMVSLGNYVWVIGGLVDQPFSYLRSVEYLNVDNLDDGWQFGPKMNTERGFHGATIINNTIYACAGWGNGQNYANCEKLIINPDGSPATGQAWVQTTSQMSQPRNDYTLVTYNNKAYTIGGYWPNIRGSPSATNVEVYDPVTDAWSVFYEAPAAGPFPNNCLGCRAAVIYASESDMTC